MSVTIRCTWCGKTSDSDELDMDQTDRPAYCPVCGHGQFDIKKKDGGKVKWDSSSQSLSVSSSDFSLQERCGEE